MISQSIYQKDLAIDLIKDLLIDFWNNFSIYLPKRSHDRSNKKIYRSIFQKDLSISFSKGLSVYLPNRSIDRTNKISFDVFLKISFDLFVKSYFNPCNKKIARSIYQKHLSLNQPKRSLVLSIKKISSSI